ncbi:unnamed protein product [Coffea canephora]|uniref:FHA domain-containing protein n=2 Tax=Coffea TaxID=13442 RepID=A0A068U0T0_COFCA|nr:unnamed protein product [Coffea canephora]
MAAAVPVSTAWIPEDDLLLKNAVEAGASLEALAKGAVQFSRRFTFQELRDRWHSLLYDPDVSAQASIRMFELELSGFNPLSRNNRFDHSKVSREVPEKRKIVSIRKQYYSMRKKFRSEFFNPTDLGFPDEPNIHDSSGNVADFRGFDRDPQDSNCVLGNSMQNHFELQESDIEILRSVFAKPTGNASVTSGAVSTRTSYLTGCSNTLEDKQPNGLFRTYGFPEDVSTPLRQDGTPFEANVKSRVMSSFIQNSSVNIGECSGIQEPGLPEIPSNSKLLESLEMQQLSAFDSRKENPRNVLRGSRQECNMNAPAGNSSFHTIGFSAADPNLSLWEPVQDFSASPLPVSLKQGDATQDAEKMLTDDGASNVKNEAVYNGVDSGPLLGVSEGEFGDLPDSLLNLSNEDDILFIDVDGKETRDKSYSDNVHSLLLSSPNDAQEDSFNDIEPQALVTAESCPTDPQGEDLDNSGAITSSTRAGDQNVQHPESAEPSASTFTSNSHALGDGNICCTLNTEDPEIPCNDDIFLLIHPSMSFAPPAAQATPVETMGLSSAASPEQTRQGNLLMDAKDLPRSSTWSQKIGPNILPETRPTCSLVGFGVKSELSDMNSKSFLPRDANKALGDLNQCKSSNANQSIPASRALEDSVSKVDLKAGECSVSFVEVHNTVAGSLKIDMSDSTAVNPSASDQEELGSDKDVPYFSDVEAMILEMDLDPHDQDLHSSKQAEVLRYQYEDAKRTIIRLEQCAQSCLQRSMTSQGALAVFYGRHLRHYIRKTEVVLGRSTDDFDVDIDLRKEGRANRISRRQAIVKMEANGSFYLKNIGKSLISVNGKLVASGQLICLGSSCLIEIRGMSFVFEINQKYARQYINSMSRDSKGKNSKFEWSPDEET